MISEANYTWSLVEPEGLVRHDEQGAGCVQPLRKQRCLHAHRNDPVLSEEHRVPSSPDSLRHRDICLYSPRMFRNGMRQTPGPHPPMQHTSINVLFQAKAIDATLYGATAATAQLQPPGACRGRQPDLRGRCARLEGGSEASKRITLLPTVRLLASVTKKQFVCYRERLWRLRRLANAPGSVAAKQLCSLHIERLAPLESVRVNVTRTAYSSGIRKRVCSVPKLGTAGTCTRYQRCFRRGTVGHSQIRARCSRCFLRFGRHGLECIEARTWMGKWRCKQNSARSETCHRKLRPSP